MDGNAKDVVWNSRGIVGCPHISQDALVQSQPLQVKSSLINVTIAKIHLRHHRVSGNTSDMLIPKSIAQKPANSPTIV